MAEALKNHVSEAIPDLDADIARLREIAGEASAIKSLDRLIMTAAERGASDIHIEPNRVRYRIAGNLVPVEALARPDFAGLSSRIKMLAHLDLAERRRPQSGRIKIAPEGQALDLRVSTLPTLSGESLVLHLVDREGAPLKLAELGFSQPMAETVRRLIDQPSGLVLVSGPVSSGKTTTLYALLDALNRDDRKIVTIEDPVEYEIEGLNQVQVQTGAGLTFASGLRLALFQNPDVVMVGEVRDLATAEMAVQAALSGQLVLSAVHDKDAAGALTHLVQLGVPDYHLADAVIGVVAQRLVKRICPECRLGERVTPGLSRQLQLERWGVAEPMVYRANGCATCGGRGFKGRLPIAEVMPISPAIRDCILAGDTTSAVEKKAVEEGMVTMTDDGIAKALAGEVTLQEVLRAAKV